MYVKLARWWASLLEKKIYVAITFGSTVLLAVSVGWHIWDHSQGQKREAVLQARVDVKDAIIVTMQKANEQIRVEQISDGAKQINELKADRDTAFARLDRLTSLMNKR